MSKEIGGVLGKGLRCYLLGADVLEVVSLFSYLGHNPTTAFVQRCQSEIMSALRVLFLRNGYVRMYLCIYIWLVTRDPRDMTSTTCSVMIHCATLSESFLFSVLPSALQLCWKGNLEDPFQQLCSLNY